METASTELSEKTGTLTIAAQGLPTAIPPQAPLPTTEAMIDCIGPRKRRQ